MIPIKGSDRTEYQPSLGFLVKQMFWPTCKIALWFFCSTVFIKAYYAILPEYKTDCLIMIIFSVLFLFSYIRKGYYFWRILTYRHKSENR